MSAPQDSFPGEASPSKQTRGEVRGSMERGALRAGVSPRRAEVVRSAMGRREGVRRGETSVARREALVVESPVKSHDQAR